jgi:competence protein ComFC
MLETLNKIKEGIVDILIPKRCLGCGQEGQYICKNCELFLSELNMFGTEPRTMSVWEYEGVVEKAIWKIKYDGCYDIISELVDKAFEKIELNLPENTYITYVPMYRKRERERGFNQAKLVAKRIGQKADRPVVGLLEKIKDNPSQVGLNPQERQENVRNVFSLAKLREAKPYSVLLVDDVYTTGATMGECTRVLKKSGIKNVYGFTIAKRMRL